MSNHNSRISAKNQGSSDKATKPARRITGKPHQRINAFRLSDIAKIIHGRHGPGPCMDGDVYRYLRAALPHIVGSRIHWLDAVHGWVVEHTPILLIVEGEDWIAEQATECAMKGKGRYPSTDKLAKLLSVTQAEVKAFNLRIIPSATRTKKVRKADRLKAKAGAEATRRLEHGATPRTASKAQTRPWVADGMNRTDWYAARKAKREAMSEACDAPDSFVDIITADVSETGVPDRFVDIISSERFGQIRGHHHIEKRTDADCMKALIGQLQAVAHEAQAEFARVVPFCSNSAWY